MACPGLLCEMLISGQPPQHLRSQVVRRIRVLASHGQSHPHRRPSHVHLCRYAWRKSSQRSLRISVLARSRSFRGAILWRQPGTIPRLLAMPHPSFVHHCWTRLRLHGCRRGRESSLGHATSIQGCLLPLDYILCPRIPSRRNRGAAQRCRTFWGIRIQ
jgi:hypothetical protein